MTDEELKAIEARANADTFCDSQCADPNDIQCGVCEDIHARRALVAEVRRLRGALTAIDRAVSIEGSVPMYHREVMNRHKSEWPTLWRAIADARKALEGA